MIVTSTFAIVGCMLQLNQAGDIRRQETALESLFSFTLSTEGDVIMSDGVRLIDRARIAVELFKATSSSAARRAWEYQAPSLYYTDEYLAHSGYKLGASVRRKEHDSGYGLHSYGGHWTLRMSLTYSGRKSGDQISWLAENRAEDKVLIEGLTRRVLARLMALDSEAAPSVQVGDSVVPTLTGLDGQRLVQIEAYCEAKGWALNKNARTGFASFTAGGKQVIVPLAAKGIKIGGEWRESDDISVMKDGNWYVPLSALNGL